MQIGTRLGAYEVIAKLGEGGMGEVYRAADTSLGRQVAIKVLPDAVAADVDRLARFDREAKTLASLNHPNIAAIYGLERSAGINALVMELVEGNTLSDVIAEGPMPLGDAIPIAKQIADALEAAHEQGIVHRDLKPANVKVRPDGTVKVLDFGLAKTIEPAGQPPSNRSLSPTITSPALPFDWRSGHPEQGRGVTAAGVILGSPAYMSPEQAKGRAADRRSDIWAFGCVLYEMLSGKRAFDGEDVSDTLALVLRGEPDWSALPATLPPPMVALIKRSLEKDPRRRIGDIAAALFVLSEPAAAPLSLPRAEGRARRGQWIAAAAAVVGLSLGGLIGAQWMSVRGRPSEAPSVTRFVVALPADEEVSAYGRRAMALSPDGRYLAYEANRRLNLQAFDQLRPAPIRGTESQLASRPVLAEYPAFSPDGRWIAFASDGQIKKISIDGGAHVGIAPAPGVTALAWEEDTIVFAAGGAVSQVSDRGGMPMVLVEGLNGRVQSLQLLPGRRAVLLTLFPPGTISGTEIVVRSLVGGDHRVVSRSGLEARYLPSGHLVYYDDGALLAVPFDVESLDITGAAVPVVEAVASEGAPGRAVTAAHFAISRSGSLAYVPRGSAESTLRTLVWVDMEGREEALGTPPRAYVYPRLSADGGRIALTVDRDIWLWNIASRNLRRFTADPAMDRYAAWTPDGTRILFGSNRGGVAATWWQSVDGTGEPQRLAAVADRKFTNFVPTSVSPDGTRVVITAIAGGADLWMVPLTEGATPTPLLASPASERNGEISPDGRWLAYESESGDQANIWVRPFPEVNRGQWQVSTDGGSQPLWSPDGKELFYRDLTGAVVRVAVDTQAAFTFGAAARVLPGAYVNAIPTFAGRLYDISPDGRRFLMMKPSESRSPGSEPHGIVVVQNWQEELKRRVLPR